MFPSPLSLARHTVALLLTRPSRSRIVAPSGAREYVAIDGRPAGAAEHGASRRHQTILTPTPTHTSRAFIDANDRTVRWAAQQSAATVGLNHQHASYAIAGQRLR